MSARDSTKWRALVKRTVPTIIVEERTLVREGVTSLLNDTPYKVVASFAFISELLDIASPPGRAALIILGVHNGLQESLHKAQNIRRTIQDTKLVVIAEQTGYVNVETMLCAGIKTGVDAIIFNVNSREVLLKALDLAFLEQQLVVIGQPGHVDRLPPDDAAPLAPEAKPSRTELYPATNGQRNMIGLREPDSEVKLSDREREVLLCIARGDPNKIIARSCSIAEATVKAHIKMILRKISVRNRTQAALWALGHGFSGNENFAPLGSRMVKPDLPSAFIAAGQKSDG